MEKKGGAEDGKTGGSKREAMYPSAAAQRPGPKAGLQTGSKRLVTPEPAMTTDVKGHVQWTQKRENSRNSPFLCSGRLHATHLPLPDTT